MPSEITAPIEDNPDFTFEQFVWRAARLMGVCGFMREEPLNARIPEVVPLPTYHQEALQKAQRELEDFSRLTDDELEERYERSRKVSLAFQSEARSRANVILALYEAIQAKVEAWTPPTEEHKGFKKEMLDQIRRSVKWRRLSPPAEPPPFLEWKASLEEELARSVHYHQGSWAREQERNKEANDWLKALRESVPQPESVT